MSSRHHEIDEAFLREARIGLMVVTVLGAIFVYVAYGKLSGWGQPSPIAYQPAPAVATNPESSIKTIPELDEDHSTSNPDAATELQIPADPPSLTSAFRPNPPSPTNQPPVGSQPTSVSQPPVGTRVASRFSPPEAVDATHSIPEDALEVSPGIENPARQTSGMGPAPKEIDRESRQAPEVPRINEVPDLNQFQVPRADQRTVGEPSTPERPTANRSRDSGGIFENQFRKPGETRPPAITDGLRDDSLERVAFQEPVGGSGKAPTKQASTPIGSVQGTLEKASIEKAANEAPGVAKPAIARTNPEKPGLPVTSATPDSEKPEPKWITTTKGQGFWIVSQNEYGDGRFFDALYQFNRKNVKSFNEVPAGTRLEIPPVNELRTRWPYLCPREELVMEGGETLFEIARDHLGQASRYTELLKLNFTRLPRNVDQNTPLKKGLKLELPRRR